VFHLPSYCPTTATTAAAATTTTTTNNNNNNNNNNTIISISTVYILANNFPKHNFNHNVTSMPN